MPTLDPRELIVRPGKRARIDKIAPDSTPGFKGSLDAARTRAEEDLARDVKAVADLQYLLYAENRRSVLVVLQGMDTSGKDGVIRHVFSGINPQGCHVTSFKKPSEREMDQDYLWRIHDAVPARGEIGVFNRAHYEDVLVVRVHELVPRKVWSKRYAQINEFEHYLTDNGVTIVKCFLHISKDEQRRRLQARLDDPSKNWKFSPQDLEERKRWDDYQEAYEDALTECSTPWAPWHVIPADRKWYRNWAVASLLRQTLERLHPRTPRPVEGIRTIKVK